MPDCNTIWSQVLKFAPRDEPETLANLHHSGRALRTASRWSQCVGLTIAQISGRNRLRDSVDSGVAPVHWLYHLPDNQIVGRSQQARRADPSLDLDGCLSDPGIDQTDIESGQEPVANITAFTGQPIRPTRLNGIAQR